MRFLRKSRLVPVRLRKRGSSPIFGTAMGSPASTTFPVIPSPTL